ncbi:MAG TPA: cytosine permease [Candidatus Lustribacter sp.]|nr:cytosine permease [Candidatus Lustribacter sp.]
MNRFVEDMRVSLIADGVPQEHQTMALDKVFWSHFTTNLAPATWVLGALLVGIGLDFRTGLLAILIGNVLGALPVGLNATIGPRTGLTQIETSRFSFGRFGTRVPSALNWLCAVGWDAVNNVPSVLALVALAAMFGLHVQFWIGLSVLVMVQMAASVYGHHVVQLVAKYLSYVLIVVFAITGVVAVLKGGSLATVHGAIRPATFVLGVSIIAGFDIGFAPYTSDYTRYLPRTTKPLTVFWLAFCGIAVSSTVIEIFGLLTASRLSDLSPAGVIAGIGTLTGPFAPVALIAIAVSAISINSINDNTASYSLISTGIRIPRYTAAIVTSACGFALAAAGAGKFAELFSNYLLLLLYWIAPWAGIVLTDRWLFGRNERPVRDWGAGATIFAIVTPLTIALFSSTEIYTGPLAKLLGGADIGFFVGFFVASLCYALVERRRSVANAKAPLPEATG